MLAVVAVVAGGGIVARHPVPLLHMCHPGAHRGHHAGELVAVGVGRLKQVAALEVFTSVPQVVEILLRTSTSPGPGAGMGTSMMRISSTS